MIALEKHPVKILHLNVRTELHGAEERTAVDIKFSFDLPNTYLDELSEGLREAFYEIDPNADPSLLDEADHLTHVRFPELGSQKFAGRYESVGLHLHLGNGRGKGDLIFVESRLDKFAFSVKEGGTCACMARAQVLPTPDETAKLVGLLKHEVPLTIDLTHAVSDDDEDEDE
ncbi:hypothetical protein [Paraburkholderia silvatlantica]|uniref:hypothetical protein n=1 Tax=Paraburkholderia silvatlantica TaxID=321895 RepID=UPI003752A0AC